MLLILCVVTCNYYMIETGLFSCKLRARALLSVLNAKTTHTIMISIVYTAKTDHIHEEIIY